MRLTHKARTLDECTAQLDRVGAGVRDELGDLVFGADDDTMESVVLDRAAVSVGSPWQPPSRSPVGSSAPA